MKLSTFVYTAVIIWASVALSSCNDKADEEAPRVIVTRPYENQPVMSVDTLAVEAIATDNERLESMTLELLDTEFHSLSVSVSVPVSGSQVDFAYDFAIDAPQLPTGNYYLAVRANDGHNIGSAYVAVQVTAIPREVQGYYAVTHASNQTRVWGRTVEQTDYQAVLTQSSDFGGAALNFRQNIFALAARTVGDAVFYDTGEFEPLRVVSGQGSSSTPYFLGMKYVPASGRFLLWRYDGRLEVYDEHAQPINVFDLLPGHIPQAAYDVDGRIYVDQKQLSGSNHVLSVYSSQGLLLFNLTIPGPCRSVSAKQNDEVYVWIDGPQAAQLQLLNLNTGLFSSPYERPGTVLQSAAVMGPGTFVLSTSDGLLSYAYPSGTTTVLNADAPLGEVVYEDVSGNYFIVDSAQVQRYGPLGQFVSTELFVYPVVYFAVDYTR